MISFRVLDETNNKELTDTLAGELSCATVTISFDKAKQIISEIVLSLMTDEDIEYALAISHGCVLIRVFDMGRYLFLYPYEICEDSMLSYAIDDICEYAMRQEIPLVFSDVPREALPTLARFRHMDLDAEDSECESYRVRVKTECQLISEIPTVTYGRVTLNALLDSDTEPYARLCSDEELNSMWGYNYRQDVANPPKSYFLETARDEFSRGIALSVAIRTENTFCGEAVLYAFDGKGSSEVAVRLLPEWQGKGLGRQAVKGCIILARKIGLTRLFSVVKNENIPSQKIFSATMELTEQNEECKIYSIKL